MMSTFWRAVAEYLRLQERDRALQAHWHRTIQEHPPESATLLPSVGGR